MAEKEGLNLSPKSIGLVILVVALGLMSAAKGGSMLSNGAATEATEDVSALIETALDERAATIAERDRIRTVNATLKEHGVELGQLKADVRDVQVTVDAIAKAVDAN